MKKKRIKIKSIRYDNPSIPNFLNENCGENQRSETPSKAERLYRLCSSRNNPSINGIHVKVCKNLFDHKNFQPSYAKNNKRQYLIDGLDNVDTNKQTQSKINKIIFSKKYSNYVRDKFNKKLSKMNIPLHSATNSREASFTIEKENRNSSPRKPKFAKALYKKLEEEIKHNSKKIDFDLIKNLNSEMDKKFRPVNASSSKFSLNDELSKHNLEIDPTLFQNGLAFSRLKSPFNKKSWSPRNLYRPNSVKNKCYEELKLSIENQIQKRSELLLKRRGESSCPSTPNNEAVDFFKSQKHLGIQIKIIPSKETAQKQKEKTFNQDLAHQIYPENQKQKEALNFKTFNIDRFFISNRQTQNKDFHQMSISNRGKGVNVLNAVHGINGKTILNASRSNYLSSKQKHNSSHHYKTKRKENALFLKKRKNTNPEWNLVIGDDLRRPKEGENRGKRGMAKISFKKCLKEGQSSINDKKIESSEHRPTYSTQSSYRVQNEGSLRLKAGLEDSQNANSGIERKREKIGPKPCGLFMRRPKSVCQQSHSRISEQGITPRIITNTFRRPSPEQRINSNFLDNIIKMCDKTQFSKNQITTALDNLKSVKVESRNLSSALNKLIEKNTNSINSRSTQTLNDISVRQTKELKKQNNLLEEVVRERESCTHFILSLGKRKIWKPREYCPSRRVKIPN